MMMMLFDASVKNPSIRKHPHHGIQKNWESCVFGVYRFMEWQRDAALSCGDDCCVLFNEKQRALRPLALS